MLKQNKDKTISIRLSQEMLEALDARAFLDEKDRTQVIREAIASYLDIIDIDEGKIEDKLMAIEHQLENLHSFKVKSEKRTNSLENRVEELSRLMVYCLERLK